MSGPISYTPPNASHTMNDAPDPPVRRRHVVYLPGYDPEARSRYRLLFVRELTLHAKRFGGGKPQVGPASLSADGLVRSWRVAAHPATDGAETSYDVLLWDDLVARDAARSKLVSAALIVIGTLHLLVTGAIAAFYRHNWKTGSIVIYPFVTLLLLGAAGTLVALSTYHLLEGRLDSWFTEIGLASDALPGSLALGLGVAAGLGLVKALEAPLNRIYFWQLLNDVVFNWQHANGWRGDYAARVDAFVDLIQERRKVSARQGRAIDEILIVGHSTGALAAIEVAARLIARDPTIGAGTEPLLSLATLGSDMPIVALQAKAARVRADIAGLVTSTRITWVDYVAPQDWLNFPRLNPIFDLDLNLDPDSKLLNPTIRSARFGEIIDEETYRKVRFRPFRMHFQFLMANDRPGAYDFFAITLGSQTLRERVLERDADASKPAGEGHAPTVRAILAA